MSAPLHEASAETIGWDIGGAHVKACRLRGQQVLEVQQWPCPLWQGLQHLAQVLYAAREQWPSLGQARHAVTMTGEMADLFSHREDGVRRIAAVLAGHLGDGSPRGSSAQDPPPLLRFFAGDAGWCAPEAVAAHWAAIASANWLASARHTALALPQQEGVLVDIGSTTTDLIAFRDGQVLTRARSDAQRLASGELVYQGVVRTPLCALARRVPWQGQRLNVMNELFATSADIYRLSGELNPAHDQHAAADGGAKSLPASRQRLARMIGLDARDGSADAWQQLAQAWRTEQVDELRGQLARVMALHGLGPQALLITAGCGDFLAPALAGAGQPWRAYADAVVGLDGSADPATRAWAQVCAPSVAVAALLAHELPATPASPARGRMVRYQRPTPARSGGPA